MRTGLTDEEVDREIRSLQSDPDVQLARAELRMKYRHRQYLYSLRNLKKRGEQLRGAGITQKSLNAIGEMYASATESADEK